MFAQAATWTRLCVSWTRCSCQPAPPWCAFVLSHAAPFSESYSCSGLVTAALAAQQLPSALYTVQGVEPDLVLEQGTWDSIVLCSSLTLRQLSSASQQATPANWPNNHENIGAKGWAFLLPTVTPEDAKAYFPVRC